MAADVGLGDGDGDGLGDRDKAATGVVGVGVGVGDGDGDGDGDLDLDMMLAGQLAGAGTILQYVLASLQELDFGLRLQGSVNGTWSFGYEACWAICGCWSCTTVRLSIIAGNWV